MLFLIFDIDTVTIRHVKKMCCVKQVQQTGNLVSRGAGGAVATKSQASTYRNLHPNSINKLELGN